MGIKEVQTMTGRPHNLQVQCWVCLYKFTYSCQYHKIEHAPKTIATIHALYYIHVYTAAQSIQLI